jgi:hypothetical protein
MDNLEYEEGSEKLRRAMGWSIVVAGLGFILWFGCEVFFGSLRSVVFWDGASTLCHGRRRSMLWSRGIVHSSSFAQYCGGHSI